MTLETKAHQEHNAADSVGIVSALCFATSLPVSDPRSGGPQRVPPGGSRPIGSIEPFRTWPNVSPPRLQLTYQRQCPDLCVRRCSWCICVTVFDDKHHETNSISASYLGPILLGTLLNAYLAGVVGQQFYTYWISGFGDPKRIRAFVVTQFAVIMLQSVVAMQALWNIFIHTYGLPLHTTQWIWQSLVNSLCQCILIWSANAFLAIRIYALTKSRFQCGLVIALSGSAFILGIVTSVANWRQLKASESRPLPVTTYTRPENATSAAWHGLQAISECLITILLARALLNARSGLQKSDIIVNHIVRSVVQIGLLGALCSLVELGTWFLFPSTTVYEIFDLTVGSIYTNVIFDTLLSRVRLRERLAENSHINVVGSTQRHSAVFQSPVTKVPDGDRGVVSIISIGNLNLATSETQGPPEQDDVESKVRSSQSSAMNHPMARNLAPSSS